MNMESGSRAEGEQTSGSAGTNQPASGGSGPASAAPPESTPPGAAIDRLNDALKTVLDFTTDKHQRLAVFALLDAAKARYVDPTLLREKQDLQAALLAAQEEVERLKGSDAHYRASYKQKLDEKMYVEKLLLTAQERAQEAERGLDAQQDALIRREAAEAKKLRAAESQVAELKEALRGLLQAVDALDFDSIGALGRPLLTKAQREARVALSDEAKPE